LNPLFSFIYEHSTAIWAAASGVVSGVGMFFISLQKVHASLDKARMRMTAEAATTEMAERAAFRASLMGELLGMRTMIRECEADRDSLRERLNVAEAQILILKASNEIMEKWVVFFRDGIVPKGSSATASA
jgi:hypothetical protein